MKTISFTPTTLAAFKKARDAATERGDDRFTFERHEFDVGYAGNLIEWLEHSLNPNKGESHAPHR